MAPLAPPPALRSPLALAVVLLAAVSGCTASVGGGDDEGIATCGVVDGICPADCAGTADEDCPEPADYYVSPSGNDANPGDIDHPFGTLEKAHGVAVAGDLVYFRGGTYHPRDPTKTVNALRGRSGTADQPIRFFAYPGERVTIDYSTMANATGVIRALDFTGDYWHWKGIDVVGTPQFAGQTVSIAFVLRDSHHCTLERMRFHDNQAIGLAISGSSSDNLVLNCDAYDNQDPLSARPYEDANGFMSATQEGTTNTFRGCRAWSNCDDGFDHFNGNGLVIHEDCWAFWNGYRPGGFVPAGNGMGFKFGNSTYAQNKVMRTCTNCVAYRNLAFGFDQNGLMDSIRLQNCTAYANVGYGIRLPHHWPQDVAGSPPFHVVQNCVAFGNVDAAGKTHDAAVNAGSTDDHNSWNLGLTVTAADFLSVDPSGIDGPRRPDGSLPDLDFLKLAPGSALVDKGADVGLPYLGSAPDLGAFERE